MLFFMAVSFFLGKCLFFVLFRSFVGLRSRKCCLGFPRGYSISILENSLVQISQSFDQ